MFLSVYEAAFVTGIPPRHLYYLLEMSRIDRAFRIFTSWRIDDSALRGLYDDYRREQLEFDSSDSGLAGFESRFEIVREKLLQASGGSAFPRMARRRGRMEYQQKRPSAVAAKSRVIQLELWPDGNYW